MAGPEALVDLAGLLLAVEAVAGLNSLARAGMAAQVAPATPASPLGKGNAMRYAIIENGVVVNVAVADEAYAAAQGWVVAPDDISPGWAYVNGAFTAPPPPKPVVPASVAMRQARLALLQAGKLADVDAAIAGLPSPAKAAAQIEWEYATEVKRDSALVTQLAPALNLDAAALDALFTQAATL
jgi:hypothetical protein